MVPVSDMRAALCGPVSDAVQAMLQWPLCPGTAVCRRPQAVQRFQTQGSAWSVYRRDCRTLPAKAKVDALAYLLPDSARRHGA